MKFKIQLFFTILAVAIAQTPQDYIKEPKPVNYVNAKQFSGLWYEIARTYNSFEKNCVAATVEYILVEPLKYVIKNRCFDSKIGAKIIEYSGTAKPSRENIMSQIDMTYYWIFTKSYTIIYLDADYSSAVMVDKEMEYVWIMNREPFMPKNKLISIISFLAQYMDTSKLIFTPQDAQGRYK